MKKVKCINARRSFPELIEGNVYEFEIETENYYWITDDLGYLKSRFEDVKVDSIVESVINQFKQRSEVGINKYGVTLDRTDLSTLEWIEHAKQEAMDFVLYLEKLKSQNYKQLILEWANERNLLKPENQYKQFWKLLEEVTELNKAIIDKDKDEQIDAIGDCVVVLTILANQLGLDIDECVKSAYNVIKTRKGKTVNGEFQKDGN